MRINWTAILEAPSLPVHKAFAMIISLVILFAWITLFASAWLFYGQWEFPLNQYTPYLSGFAVLCTEASLFLFFKKAVTNQQYSKAQSWFIGMLLAGVIGLILLLITLF